MKNSSCLLQNWIQYGLLIHTLLSWQGGKGDILSREITFRHLYFLVRISQAIATTNGNISRLEQSEAVPARAPSSCTTHFAHQGPALCAPSPWRKSEPPEATCDDVNVLQSCTYLSSIQACPTSIPVPCRGTGAAGPSPAQGAEMAPAPEAGLVSPTGSAHPQQVPTPWLHPKPVQGQGQSITSPEHGSGRVHPLACPQELTGRHHQVLAVQDQPQLRKMDVVPPRGILTLVISLCLKKASTTDQGGVRGEATEITPN